MRRISLALALVGAVAAAGCSGGAKTSSDNGGAAGVAQGNFTVTIQNGQGQTGGALKIKGGLVKSVSVTVKDAQGVATTTPDTQINCGEDGTGAAKTACAANYPLGAEVVLTATGTAAKFYGWAGDCTGIGDCTLAGNADKYVVASFGVGGNVTVHPNWVNDTTQHPAAYDGALFQCNTCHGWSLTGAGIAPSCYSCHATIGDGTIRGPQMAGAGHFDAAAAPWSDHGGWSQACQRCHTDQGFRDYVGEDGRPNNLDGSFKSDNTKTATTAACTTAVPSTCDPAAYKYGPLKCQTCHNAVSDPKMGTLNQIMFPSAQVVSTDSVTALCGTCHQARESTASMDKAIGTTGLDSKMLDPTKTDGTGLGFINPHYLGAAATLFGRDAQGWAQYPGKTYTAQNKHGGLSNCTYCHDAHNGDLPADRVVGSESPNDIQGKCGKCHFDELSGAPVATFTQLEESRQFGYGEIDVDGDGTVESLRVEIDGLAAKLNEAMVAYSTSVIGSAITYTDAYPYFMNPASAPYKAFTPRLMRAAFNYKWYKADPGAWAHNPRYAIEILNDAIADLNAGLVANSQAAVAFDGYRSFEGHFGGASATAKAGDDVFHDWDSTGTIPNACSQCHGGEQGMTNYLADRLTTKTNASITGMQCTTCHVAVDATAANFKGIRTIAGVNFAPTSVTPVVKTAADFVNAKDMICATCHSGRENKASVDASIGVKTDAEWTVSFTNPHYLGAAATLFGADAHMMYEYTGKTYAGKNAMSCTGCHNPQASKHSFAATLPADTTNKTNIETLASTLYTSIQTYGQAAGKFVCYNGDAYPYWFNDTNKDGTCDATESVRTNGAKLNPTAAKAAFNYKWSQAEPGAWVHNYNYMAQILVDSIESVGGTTTITRP